MRNGLPITKINSKHSSMSSLISIADDKKFALSNQFFSYVFQITDEGLLEHIYYGTPLKQPLDVSPQHQPIERGLTTHFEGIKHLNLNELPQEYPAYGRSDYRYPAFHGRNADGNSVFSLHYKSHTISKTKKALTDLPIVRGGGCEQLIVTLEDRLYGLDVDLIYTVYEHHGVLVRSAAVSYTHLTLPTILLV